jgi:class 3 adenylate cyclase
VLTDFDFEQSSSDSARGLAAAVGAIMSAMADTALSPLERARGAAAAHRWSDAYELFRLADGEEALDGRDLELLADSAWTTSLSESIRARERAYTSYVTDSCADAAARVALRLSRETGLRGQEAVSRAWLARAERLLADLPESRSHGYLALAHGLRAASPDEAIGFISTAVELGRRHGDRDLELLAQQELGAAYVAAGHVADGLALVDDAACVALAGEPSPIAAGTVYCQTIALYRNLGDLRRAAEWAERTLEWCEVESLSGFPGICRIHRAEILRARGDLDRAEAEARRACTHLEQFNGGANARPVAEAFYALGEIRLVTGDFTSAEAAFAQALSFGLNPVPGLALLRARRGNVPGAVTAIDAALREAATPAALVHLLDAGVEIAIAAGDLERAASRTAELEQVADTMGTDAARAAALVARGRIALAAGDATAATSSLEEALSLWLRDVPYEAARARALLGVARRLGGDAEGGALEFRASHSTFERLGAKWDAVQVETLLAEGQAVAERRVQTFMFTDMGNSTALAEAIGDQAWHDLVRWHDHALRRLFESHGGEEVDHAGDGFFVAFPEPIAALECARAIQSMLSEHRRLHGFAPAVRIGMHVAEATRAGTAYRGRGVHEAARIAALAEPGAILASRKTLDVAGLRGAELRSVTLKGIATPVEVGSPLWPDELSQA